MALSSAIEDRSRAIGETVMVPKSRKWSNRRDEGLTGLAWEDSRIGVLTNDFEDRMKAASQGNGLEVYDNEGVYVGHRTKLTVAEMDEYVKEMPKWMVVAGRIVGATAAFWSGASGALQALHEGVSGNGNSGSGENSGHIASVASLDAGYALLRTNVEPLRGDDWKFEAPPRGMKGVLHPDVVSWRGEAFDQGLGVTNGAFEGAIRGWKQWYQDGVYVELGGRFGELPDHQVLKDAGGAAYIVFSGDMVDTKARGTESEKQKTLFIAQADQEGVGEPELLAKIGGNETSVLFGALKLEDVERGVVAPVRQFLLLKDGGGFGVQDGGGGMSVMSGPEGWTEWLINNAGVTAATKQQPTPEPPKPTATEGVLVLKDVLNTAKEGEALGFVSDRWGTDYGIGIDQTKMEHFRTRLIEQSLKSEYLRSYFRRLLGGVEPTVELVRQYLGENGYNLPYDESNKYNFSVPVGKKYGPSTFAMGEAVVKRGVKLDRVGVVLFDEYTYKNDPLLLEYLESLDRPGPMMSEGFTRLGVGIDEGGRLVIVIGTTNTENYSEEFLRNNAKMPYLGDPTGKMDLPKDIDEANLYLERYLYFIGVVGVDDQVRGGLCATPPPQ